MVLSQSLGYLWSNVRSFIILRSRVGLTSFNTDNSAIFSNEKKVQWSFPGYLFFSNTRKNFKLNLVLFLVVLVLESKGLCLLQTETNSLTTWFHSFVRVWLTENWTSVAYCEWKKEREEEIKFHMSTSLQSKFRNSKASESLHQFQLWLSLYKQSFIDLLIKTSSGISGINSRNHLFLQSSALQYLEMCLK